MGILGRITGWDQQKDAHNAVLANHFVETGTLEAKRRVAQAIVFIHHKANFYRNLSNEALLANLSTLARIKQMNFVAIGCIESGTPSNIPGVQFADVGNPYRSESESSLNRISVALTDLSRRAGRQLDWPGNDMKVDFVSWGGIRPSESLDSSPGAIEFESLKPKRAAQMASHDLLADIVDQRIVEGLAVELSQAKVARSDHELAVATALFLFEHEALRPQLFEAQLMAQMRVAHWMLAGLVRPEICSYFEQQLYISYKP